MPLYYNLIDKTDKYFLSKISGYLLSKGFRKEDFNITIKLNSAGSLIGYECEIQDALFIENTSFKLGDIIKQFFDINYDN